MSNGESAQLPVRRGSRTHAAVLHDIDAQLPGTASARVDPAVVQV
jgi:hypothetical protein